LDVKYFAPFRMDLPTETLWRGDVRVPLTHKAFQILRVLVDRAGHVVPRDSLLGAVWPDTNVHPDNVKVLIGEIRRALGDDPGRPQYIRSIVKRGYIFIAPVVEAPLDLTAPADLPIFVGRGAEMNVLLDAFDTAVESNRQMVFITGDSGVGKTALCEAFLRVAARRHAMRATWAQCVKPTGPAEPYCPLVDVVTRLARSAGDDSVHAILSRHAPSWYAHKPGLSAEARRTMTGQPNGPAARKLREIVTALEALTDDTTLVVWLEDLHWADPATIDVINSLGQRPDPARLLVLATTRPPDSVPTAGPLRRSQADLLAHGRARQIRLQPFGANDVTSYLDVRFGSEISTRASEVLYRTTNGNPLFLVTAIDHLVRQDYISCAGERWALGVSAEALEAAIPASVARAVARDLDELAPDERLAIGAASVLGAQFSLWLAAHAAGVDELALEAVLETLARRQRFIARDGVMELANGLFSPLYRFKHSLYQEIVLEETAPAVQAAAHERAGLATERLFAGREHEVVGDLACHFHGAGDHGRAARYLKLAAENAIKRYAPREAAALLHGAVTHASYLAAEERRSVELPMMLELGRAQLAAGETSLALETLGRLARRAGAAGQPNEQLRALLVMAEAQSDLSREETLDAARKIGDVAAMVTDPTLGATATVRAGMLELQFESWSDEIADRCVERWRSIPRTLEDESRSLAIRLLFLQTTRSAYQAAWTAGRRLLPPALRSGNLGDTLYCCYSLGVAALHLGRWGDAMEVALEGAAIADKAGSTRHAVVMRLLQAWIALEGQRWDEARRLSVAERPLVEGQDTANPLQMSLLFGGAAAIGQGDFDQAAADLERLRDWYRRDRLVLDWFWKSQLHGCLAELALRRGDLSTAVLEAQAAQEAADATPERTWRGRSHVIAAQVALERQTFADADRHLRQARRETRGIDAPLASWRIEAVTATLLERTAQPDSARRARMKYERTFHRLERSIDEHHFSAPVPPPLADGDRVH
jgi:DNA-binding winged helix-turn-helix (wHTH) protein